MTVTQIAAGGMTSERHDNARERFEERAGILEFCAGFPRNEAERIAKRETAEWLKANPEQKEQAK